MLPHVIGVNRAGHRFVDESAHNCALALGEIDPATGSTRNQPAWAIADANYRERYPLAGAAPGEPLPHWVRTAETLVELATATGIDPAGLADTVAAFNAGAAEGRDP